jgi:hypothetical protein
MPPLKQIASSEPLFPRRALKLRKLTEAIGQPVNGGRGRGGIFLRLITQLSRALLTFPQGAGETEQTGPNNLDLFQGLGLGLE